MNKTTTSLSQGFLSVLLILSLVLPSLALPFQVLALEGAAGGQADGSQYGDFGGGDGGSDAGAGEADSDGDGTSDSAESAASAAAAESVASAASVAGVEVGVSAVDTTNDPDAVAGKVSVDGVTMSVEAAMAAIGAIADAQSKGMTPSTNSSVPGIDVAGTLSANAMGELGSVVGSMTAEVGDVQSVAAAESKAATGLQALGIAAGINGMNPASSPAANANAALAALAAHPAMLSPLSMVNSLPPGFTFSPPSTVNISPTPMNGLAAPTATFSTQNQTIDVTAFSFADDFSLDDTDDANFVDDPASLDQYSQYALGMEIGRMATQKSLAESKHSTLAAQANQPFASTNQAQVAAIAAAKAEVDAWAATIDSRLNPTTQNQAVAVISQDKATAVGKMASAMEAAINAADTSKANQLAQEMSVVAKSYDNQIADAKNSVAAAQKSLADANVVARSSVNAALGNVVAVNPLGTLSKPDSVSSVTDIGTAVTDALTAIGLNPATAVIATNVAAVIADMAFLGILGDFVDSYEYSSAAETAADPDSKAALSAQADQSFAQAVTGAATAVAGIGIANGFVGAVSAGIGKSAAFGIGSSASKSTTAAAPAAASTAGKTAAGTTGKTVSVSYNPTTNTVTVHAPVSTSAVVEGKIAGTAAKSADNVAAPSSLAGKAADDVATPSTAASGKTPTAANSNTPANPSATGYQTATTPASQAAKSADNVAAPSSLAGKAADDVATPSSVTAAKSVDNVSTPASPTSGKTPTANVGNNPANPSALGSKSATTPTPATSPASKATSVAMAVVEALSAPVSLGPAAISKSLAGIADDISSFIARTADDITTTAPTSIAVKSADNVAVNTATKSVNNAATAPVVAVSAPAKSTTPLGVTAPIGTQTTVAPATNQTAPATTQANPTVQATAQPAAPTTAQTNPTAPTSVAPATQTATAPSSNQTAPATTQTNPTVQATAQPATPTVLGTIAVNMPESLGRTSTLGTPQTATLSTNPVTGLVDVTLNNQPQAQVNSITPAQAQNALATSKASPLPNDFLSKSLAALADFVAPPAQVIGTFTLSIPDKNTTPSSVTITTVSPTEVAASKQQSQQGVSSASTQPAQLTAPATTQTNPTVQATAQPTTANPVATTPTFAPTDLGKYTIAPAVQATPATEVALGLKSLGEPTTKMNQDAAAAGFTIESPQQAVAIGIAHEVSPKTRDAIVDAYTRDGNFDSLPDSIIAEPAAFINAIANEAAGKDRSVVQQVAFANYLSSVTVDKKAYDTMANPQTRAALTELAKQLTNGTIAAKRGLDVAAPAKTANHFYASYITPSWAKALIDKVTVGASVKTVTGLAPKETNPAEEGVKSVLNRIDQAALFSPDSLADMPASAKTVLAFADKLSKSTPAALALEIQAAAAARIAQALPQAKAPAAANPSTQTQAPAQAQVAPTQNQSRVVMQNRDATRDLDITQKLKDQIVYAAEKANVIFVGTSGGQPSKNDVARGLAALTDRTGSNRHDHGNAVDGYLKDADTGRVLNFTNPNDLPRFETFITEAVKAGITGVGAGVAYMGPKTIHVGGGSALAWGAGGKVANAPRWLTVAHQKGLAEAKSFDLAAYKASQPQTLPNSFATTPTVTTAIPTSRPTMASNVAATSPNNPTVTSNANTTPVPSSSAVDSNAPSANNDNGTIGYPSNSGQNDSTPAPTANAGVPPDYQSIGGTGPAPRAANVIDTISSTFFATVAVLAAAINSVFGTDIDTTKTSEDALSNGNIATGQVNVPANVAPAGEAQTTTQTPSSPSTTQTPVTPAIPTKTTTQTPSSPSTTQTPVTPAIPTKTTTVITSGTGGSTSTTPTINVLIQVEGESGDLYFSIAGVYDDKGDLLADSDSYAEQEPDNEATGDSEFEQPRIVLDDQRLNILYSDGTYAPVIVDGVWYESPSDPRYIYTVEYYLDGEIVSAADNAGVLPEGNPLTNLLGNLFSSTNEYRMEDINAVTRALVDPNEQVPADEYYIYRVYLNGGSTRSTTVPRYTSYRFMSERFAETGFTGNVAALIAASVEVPPPSRGGVSAIVNTFKKIGLSVVDMFRDAETANPVVTDFGNLTPSDDGVITMSDIRTVTVLLDVEAECPLAPGLDRPYLYEIVIAQAAITGATTDQAFRAVRCGGGDKADFVEQIASHFESFDGVGTIDRTAMSDIIRFALFKDLDLSSIFAAVNEETTGTSTAPTVPKDKEVSFTPNLTNEVVFEVKAVGSQGQTLLDWTTSTEISIGSGVQLYFRWSGTAYEQCLPFLNDNGIYALKARGSKMTTGNTESEGYDVPETSATYRIECGGQRNNEYGVDDRSIKVIIK